MKSLEFHCAELSEQLLYEAFPFHIVVSETGIILSCGHSLKNNLDLKINSDHLFDCFSIQHPMGISNINHFSEKDKNFFLLVSNKNDNLTLRGQLVVDRSGRCLVFLVSPWVTDVDKLDTLGLSLTDFPVHNPLSDFLLLLQTQRISLKDSQRLSEELAELNKELEGRVVSRTAALELKAQELKESKTTLEREMQERQRVEIELRHAQKLETVGQLAAGIAHEINTPMQYIGNSLSFLQDSFSELELVNNAVDAYLGKISNSADSCVIDLQSVLAEADLSYICERAPKALNRAVEGIERVTEIIRAMNEFTHPDRSEMDTANINQALDTVLAVSKNEYKYVADIKRDFQELPLVNCYLGDMNQVFLNLIVNAAHTIADSSEDKGSITIKTRVDCSFILISIADTGTGIPEEIQHRIFDPFFTTKDVGKGTGQGLAISHKIVIEKHGGKLSFETQLGKGTTFTIALPISGAAEHQSSNQLCDKRRFAA